MPVAPGETVPLYLFDVMHPVSRLYCNLLDFGDKPVNSSLATVGPSARWDAKTQQLGTRTNALKCQSKARDKSEEFVSQATGVQPLPTLWACFSQEAQASAIPVRIRLNPDVYIPSEVDKQSCTCRRLHTNTQELS